jgi:hypothetical protein
MKNRALIGVVLLAGLLRLLRAALRWDEIALAYAAYHQPWQDAFFQGDLGGMLLEFTGLHPPLHAFLWSVVDGLWGAPAGWLLLSVACSTGAVWCVGRVGGVAAAAVLAVAPLQLAYAAEVNDYPLLVLLVALCLKERFRPGRSPTRMAVVGILAGWTHVLGGVVAGACAVSLWRSDRRAAFRVGVAIVVGCSPVLFRGFQLAMEEGAYGQAGLDLPLLFSGLTTKIGAWWLVLPIAAWGARRRPLVGGVAVVTGGVVLLFIALGVAAPHQHPYWLVLGPPVAILVAAASHRAAWVVALVGAVLFVPPEWSAWAGIQDNLQRERAIDRALAQARPQDAIWLLSPALKPDDDKTDRSDVLWRFSPWIDAPAWRTPRRSSPPAFEYVDYRYGQPRILGGHVTHQTTDLDPAVLAEVAGWHGENAGVLWLVLYDHGPADDYPGLVDRALADLQSECEWVGEDVGLGVDRLCRIGEGE